MLSSPNAATTTLWETRPRSWLQHAANLEVCEAQTRCPLIKFPRLCFVRLKCHVLPIGSGQCLAVKWGTSSTWSYLLTPIFFLFFLCHNGIVFLWSLSSFTINVPYWCCQVLKWEQEGNFVMISLKGPPPKFCPHKLLVHVTVCVIPPCIKYIFSDDGMNYLCVRSMWCR